MHAWCVHSICHVHHPTNMLLHIGLGANERICTFMYFVKLNRMCYKFDSDFLKFLMSVLTHHRGSSQCRQDRLHWWCPVCMYVHIYVIIDRRQAEQGQYICSLAPSLLWWWASEHFSIISMVKHIYTYYHVTLIKACVNRECMLLNDCLAGSHSSGAFIKHMQLADWHNPFNSQCTVLTCMYVTRFVIHYCHRVWLLINMNKPACLHTYSSLSAPENDWRGVLKVPCLTSFYCMHVYVRTRVLCASKLRVDEAA